MSDLTAMGELFRILNNLIKRRKLARAKIFADEVKPLLEDLQKTHTEFLCLIKEMEHSIAYFNSESERQPNVSTHLENQLKLWRNKQLRLEERRGGRVLTHARAKERASAYTANIARKIALTPTEKKTVFTFFLSVAEYFEATPSIYNHKMRDCVRQLAGIFELALKNGYEKRTYKENVTKLLGKLKEQEYLLANRWSIIASNFARVEAFLIDDFSPQPRSPAH